MPTNILFFHSILRYFILLFMVIVILQSLSGMLLKRSFRANDRVAALLLMILCDLQLLAGLMVYMTGGWISRMGAPGAMKDHPTRFFAMEHPLMMLIAIILVHIGYSAAKKNTANERKFRFLFWCTTVALFLVLVMIPWPGMNGVGRAFLPSMSVHA